MQHFSIPASLVLEVSGKDALRYLHNRLTNDVRSLAPGQLTFAAALTPQGKTEGFFSLLRLAEDRFILICDGGDPAKVIAGLKRFIVADRVEVVDGSSSYCLVHIILSKNSDNLPQVQNLPSGSSFSALDEAYLFKRVRGATTGYDVLIKRTNLVSQLSRFIPSDSQELSSQEQTFQRIQAGWPQFPTEINESTLFSESGLVPVAASFKKGCYVGQEVLEKVEAFGSLPRALRRGLAAHSGSIENGAKAFSTETQDGEDIIMGKVVTAARSIDGNSTRCFVSVRALDAGFPSQVVVNGVPLALAPIL